MTEQQEEKSTQAERVKDEEESTQAEAIREEKEQSPPEKLSEEEKQLRQNLKEFYRDHFDLDTLWRVIDKKNLPTREFGFDRLGRGFTRNKSFKKPDHLLEYLTTFPVAGVYIGGLYKDRLLPSTKYTNYQQTTIHQTEWLGRELVFDLDLDEYDPVRPCDCKGREVCEDCWSLMQKAADIMDETLRQDFGLEELEWVYTGGRGYHCWVLDEKTFDLDQEQRSAVIGYMQLIHDPTGTQKVDDIPDEARRLKERIYRKIGREYILEAKKKTLYEEAGFTRTTLNRARDQLELSELISDIVDAIPNEEKFQKSVIRRFYPRIDHKVTIDTRRLLRMPGSVHIKTKNISEYLEDPTTFNPITDATNLHDLVGDNDDNK